MHSKTIATERAHARCEDCQCEYRIPDPEHTYRCKRCGGTVRVTPEDELPHPHLVGALTCEECHAINHAGTEACVECGSPLSPDATYATEEEAARARRDASTALRKGYRWIAAFTWVCRAGALGYSLVTLSAILALGSADVPERAGLLVVYLTTIMTALMLMGSIQILFQPVLWTVVIASVATVVSLAHVVGPNPLGVAFVWSALWAAAFWVGVLPTLRFKRLVQEHTDLYILQRSSQRTRRQIEAGGTRHRHDRLLRVMRNAKQAAWRYSAIGAATIAALSVAGTWIVTSSVRPKDLEPYLATFERAWRAGDEASIEAMFAGTTRQWQSTRLAGLIESHGWKDAMPRLVREGQRVEDEDTWVDYRAAGMTLETRWTLSQREWLLVEVDLPIPPFEPVLARFERAWDSSSVKGLAAFFSPDNQAEMQDSIERVVRRRGWTRFPERIRSDWTAIAEGEVEAYIDVTTGTVSTNWSFRPDGKWGLTKLKLPEQ